MSRTPQRQELWHLDGRHDIVVASIRLEVAHLRNRMRQGVVIDLKFLRALRQVSRIEGVSTLVLFGIAMPLKYFAGMPRAVTVVGSIHGALFVGLVAMFVVAVGRVPISLRVALTGMLAAVFPFGPFWFDRHLAEAAMESPKETDTIETNGRL